MNQIPKNDASKHDITPQGIKDVGVLAILVALAMGTTAHGFFGDNENISSQITNISEIIQETDNFAGRSVTIRSKAVQRVGLRSFAVNDRRFFGGKPIVVINASGVPFDLPRDENIQIHVTGQVRNLNIANIERDFKLNIQDEYYQDYINKPAIIARYIALAPQPAQVTSDPEPYYGRSVAMMGKVKDIQSPFLLKLDKNNLIGGGQDFVVLFKEPPKVAINKGQTLAIMGEVRPFVVADIERDYKLNWNLNVKRKLEAEYANTPVLIADSVYP